LDASFEDSAYTRFCIYLARRVVKCQTTLNSFITVMSDNDEGAML